MCGIAGIIGSVNPELALTGLTSMIGSLERRGPDGEGIEAWDGAWLGHRRLAIFDLSDAGQQPMVTADRSVGVVFNGAIYNFRELRASLRRAGYRFRSETDTEVLLHGYQEWGIDELVARLRGMFAFGLWDNRLRKLYLVRDRLGVKPLVFATRGNVIAFASTVRALRLAGYAGDLDLKGMADFLEWGFVTDRHSIYQRVRKVPAATIVEWSDGTTSQRTFWTPPAVSDSSTLSFDDVVDQTERLLLDAVKVRLHADVPVGILLSSGIDSSLVCWAASKLGHKLTAYTIGTPGGSEDESVAAQSTAQTLGIDHQIVEMTPQKTPEIDELVSAYAEPFACASALGMLRVSRAIAPFAKVLLTGDGGDDIFLGYPRHRHLWYAEKLSNIGVLAPSKWWPSLRPIFPQLGPTRRLASLLDYATGDLRAFIRNGDTSSFYRSAGILGDRFFELGVNEDETRLSTSAGHQFLAALLDFEQKTRFVGEYLPKVDGATMHYGLEARSPFLDQFLWEFAAQIPFELRLRSGRLKAILREIAARRIGPEVATRRKRGFTVPVQRWIANGWRPLLEASFQESVLDMEGWIRSDKALTQIEVTARTGWAPEQLWYLFVLESWMKDESRNSVNLGAEEKIPLTHGFHA